MTFYTPWGLSALVLIPVIIILYLLKQRHQDYTVSSLFLWEEVLRDLEANAPWQKLKKNILMMLQILAIIFLALAMSRPFLNAVGGEKGSVIVAIDTSLSMQADDVGKSRFEEAKSRAQEYISNLKPGTKVTLISMGRNAVILENISDDKNSLLQKLTNLKVTNGISNIDDARSLISSIARQNSDTEVVVFSDTDFSIPGVNMNFSKISNSGENFAIVLLSHTRTENGFAVLSRIANYSAGDEKVPVSLYVDGRVFDAKNVDIKKGDISNVYWNNIPEDIKLLEVRIDRKDSLSLDNTAWNAVNPSNSSKVLLVTERNVFIEKAVSISSGIELYKTGYDDTESLKGYNLYILDGFIPEKLPQDGNIMILAPTQNDLFEMEGEVKNPVVETLDEEIFRYISSYDFSIGKTRIIKTPKWGKEILRFKEGTGAFSGQYEKRRVLVFGFDVHNTDIPLTPAFPILMTNALEWLLPSTIKNIESVYPGEALNFNLDPKAQEAFITTPSGRSIKVAPPFPASLFYDTDEVGIYTLNQKMAESESSFHFTVNVPAEQESDLMKSEIKDSGNDASGGTEEVKPVNTGMNLQWIFLWVILALLLIEWWVYTNGI